MNRPDTPSLALLVAAGLLLVSQAPNPASASQLPATPAPARAALPAPPSYTTLPNCIPAWVIDSGGARRLPDRCFQPTVKTVGGAASMPVTAAVAPAAPQTARATPPRAPATSKEPLRRAGDARKDCSKSYSVDARGVRRLRASCL